MEGWIKLHRKFLKWEWYSDSEMVHLFLHLLLKANHAPKKWKGITIEKGQVLTGRKVLSREINMSEDKIRTRLKRLVDTQEITIKTTSKYSIITICNYCQYQTTEKENPQVNPQQIPNGSPTDPHKQEGEERKEIKKEQNSSAGKADEKMNWLYT
jgi:DNA replication protein DnaD